MLPELSFGAAVALEFLVGGTAGALFGHSPLRRVLASLFLIPAMVVPFLLPAEPAVGRFFLAMMSGVGALKMIDLHQEPSDLSLGQRILFMCVPFESPKMKRVRPEVRVSLLVGILLWGLIFTGSIWLFGHLPPSGETSHILLGWTLGLIGFYAVMEFVAVTLVQSFLLLGYELPPLHRNPILARTIQEFWGERWNISVHNLLFRSTFKPFVRRRRPMMGVMATFIASSVLHIWLMGVALGWKMGTLWGIFFFIQGIFIIVERRLRVGRWPGIWPRVWTLTVLTLSSPLFIEPMLRVFPGKIWN